MSSVIRYVKEQTPISQRFTVFPYYGVSELEYYFTVQGTSLYRIEADLSGDNQWIVARDMGKETFINTIDHELIEYWENLNSWSNTTVVRKGRARKYQLLAIPAGNITASDNNGPAWNAGGYTDPDGDMSNTIYNYQNTGINDLLIEGHATTTIFNDYNQNLPFGTFWAVIDPVVIRYTYNGNTYTRAIVNRVVPS
jgi:hypothetical protein